MKNTSVSLAFMLLAIGFCICLITSNFLETKVIAFGGLTITGGFLVFPFSYVINDCIVEIWGYRKMRFVIWVGFTVNFLVLALTQLVLVLPAAPYWEGGEAFRFVFGLAPRIACASLLAFLSGSFLNAYIMSRMKIASQGKNFSLRAVVSTLGGESLDSLVFFPIAFGGLVSLPELCELMLTQAVAKTLYEIVVLPLTCRVVGFLKRWEQTDVYDGDISYSILRIREF